MTGKPLLKTMLSPAPETPARLRQTMLAWCAVRFGHDAALLGRMRSQIEGLPLTSRDAPGASEGVYAIQTLVGLARSVLRNEGVADDEIARLLPPPSPPRPPGDRPTDEEVGAPSADSDDPTSDEEAARALGLRRGPSA